MTLLGVNVQFLIGSQKAAQRREIMPQLADGRAQFVIGTQALIQDQVKFKNLALVLLDEQHRFGVEQRLALSKKGLQTDPEGHELWPHQLTLSATPIPRSLAMTYYADLGLSVIDELPPRRQAVQTKLVAEQRRSQVVAVIHREVAICRQFYCLC